MKSYKGSSQCEQTLVPKSSIQTIVGMVHENISQDDSILGNSNVIYTVDQGIKLIMTLGGIWGCDIKYKWNTSIKYGSTILFRISHEDTILYLSSNHMYSSGM